MIIKNSDWRKMTQIEKYEFLLSQVNVSVLNDLVRRAKKQAHQTKVNG